MKRTEWRVDGPSGSDWIEARDGDDAVEKYVARHQVKVPGATSEYAALDLCEVTDVRDVEGQ